MVAVIFTWIGALAGIAILLAMAFGAFVLDCHDALADRRVRHQADKVPDPPAG